MPKLRLKKPPVVERVLTLQFLPLSSFELFHFGLWREHIKSQFPHFNRQQPLGRIKETFPLMPDQPRLNFNLRPLPPLPRCVFASNEGSTGRLHQLQVDRFAMNLPREESDSYTTFDEASRIFLDLFEKFQKFCDSQDLPRPKLDWCEVIYVNRIPCHTDDVASRWTEVFRAAEVGHRQGWLPAPSLLAQNTAYDFPEHQGRLRVDAAAGHHDRKPAIFVKLIGRAAINSSSVVAERVRLAHDWIVDGFEALTNDAIRKHEWEQS